MNHEGLVMTVIAVVGLLLVATLLSMLLKRLRIPYTVGLVLAGLVIGRFTGHGDALESLGRIELSPDLVMFVFLPTLIFESAFNLDARLLARNIVPVLTLAAPGLIISTVIVGFMLSALTSLSIGPALLFGALISATDPVAVVALFKEVGAPKRLAMLVEGESLFNDATAIVLFKILLVVLMSGAFGLNTVGQGLLDFGIVFIGGLLVGTVIGWLMIRSIVLAQGDALVQVGLSTVVAYAAFIAAEHTLHVSGVMATLGAGAVVGALGSTRFSEEVRHYLHQFWEFAAFVANSLIFLLVGLTVRMEWITGNLGAIGWSIVAILVARAVVVYGLLPIVGRVPGAEPVDHRYKAVIYWGGLRGAVALALAFGLPETFAEKDLILALAIGVVLFTLLAGGLTMAPLIRALGLDRPSTSERLVRAEANLAGQREALSRIQAMARAGHLSERLLDDLEARYRSRRSAAERELTQILVGCSDAEMAQALGMQALTIELAAYREQFDKGVISEAVLHELELFVDLERDSLKEGRPPVDPPSLPPLEVLVADRFMRVLEMVAPRSGPVQRHRLRRLVAKYEHDSAVLQASRHVVAEIRNVGEAYGIRGAAIDGIRTLYERRGAVALQRLDQVAEHFPEYVAEVQRRAVWNTALDGESDEIDRFAGTGSIPPVMAQELRHAVQTTRDGLKTEVVGELRPQTNELLARVPLFSELKSVDMGWLAALLVPRTVLAGETVVRQGDKGNSLFLIVRGVVAVLRAREGEATRRVASLHAGDFFGEMAFLNDQPRSATVQAISDCQFFELPKKSVAELIAAHPEVGDHLASASEKRRLALEGTAPPFPASPAQP